MLVDKNKVISFEQLISQALVSKISSTDKVCTSVCMYGMGREKEREHTSAQGQGHTPFDDGSSKPNLRIR